MEKLCVDDVLSEPVEKTTSLCVRRIDEAPSREAAPDLKAGDGTQ
jgi:hypothetical protein